MNLMISITVKEESNAPSYLFSRTKPQYRFDALGFIAHLDDSSCLLSLIHSNITLFVD